MTDPIRILVAEDNPVFRTLLKSLLAQWGYETVLARDGREAWALLQADDYPLLAILDWMMPGLDGLEICRRLRALAREPYVYVLLLTARSDHDDLLQGMEAGADDYVTKPFEAHELRARLRAGIRIVRLQQELMRTRDQLRDQAARDGLTGLWNHKMIFETLQKELARGARQSTPLSLIMADLDFFKLVNDTYGHLAGDVVLCESARRMTEVIRRYDSIGRYGGEEFMVILPQCDLAVALPLAERLRNAIASQPFEVSGNAISVTCSLGIACTESPESGVRENLVRAADTALYEAKRAGRNRIEVAPTSVAAPLTIGRD